MKLLKYLLPILITASCFADSNPIRNDTPTQLRDLGSNLNVGANFAVNKYGQLQCVMVAGDGAATSAVHFEDTPFASGDAGVAMLAIRNDSFTSQNANLDYGFINVNAAGNVYPDIQVGGQVSNTGGLLKQEDVAAGGGDAGVAVYAVREDALTVNTNTTNDYTPFKTDSLGRQITTYAPPGETWTACGTATATTGDVAIKAAVASNRIYVTSIVCKNTSATVATTLDFKDGTTIYAVGGIGQMAAAAPGSFNAVFPVPLRGTSATALNFATNVSVSSVTCCAAGYISVG